MIFGTDRLARSVGVASSSLRRYVAHHRDVPDDVAGRTHLLAASSVTSPAPTRAGTAGGSSGRGRNWVAERPGHPDRPMGP